MLNFSLTEILLIILSIEFFVVVGVLIFLQNRIKEMRKDLNQTISKTTNQENEVIKYDKRITCIENALLRQELNKIDKVKNI